MLHMDEILNQVISEKIYFIRVPVSLLSEGYAPDQGVDA